MIDRGHDLADHQASRGSSHQPRQHLLPAAAGAGGRSCDHAASRPAASGVPLRRLADVARPAGGRGVQDRPPSREDVDAADGDRGALSPSAHDQTRARPQNLPISAARAGDHAAEPGVGDGHYLHRDGARLRLPRRGARLVQPPRPGVAAVDYDGGGVLHRDAGGRLGALRQAGDIQHRPGLAVHWPNLHRRARRQWHSHQHGRQRRLARQRVCRAALAQRQIRGGVSARLRQRQRSSCFDRPVF